MHDESLELSPHTIDTLMNFGHTDQDTDQARATAYVYTLQFYFAIYFILHFPFRVCLAIE